MITGRPTASKTALRVYARPLSAQDDTGEELPDDRKKCDPTIAPNNDGGIFQILRHTFFIPGKERVIEFHEENRTTCFEDLCWDTVRTRSFVVSQMTVSCLQFLDRGGVSRSICGSFWGISSRTLGSAAPGWFSRALK